MANTFSYGDKALGKHEIRILKLKWAEEHEPLEGILLIRVLQLDQMAVDEQTDVVRILPAEGETPAAEPYDALSYPWGPNKKASTNILLSYDKAGSIGKEFPIRDTLEAALLMLRARIHRPGDYRLVWVDAICINQLNLVEKGTQIPLMAEIYSRAAKVCVWLGKEMEDSVKAIAYVEQIVDLDKFDKLLTDPQKPPEWDAFCSLLKRSWFSRRWIVQEIAVARKATLYCGKSKVSWDRFANAVSLFSTRREELRLLIKNNQELDHHPDYLGEIQKFGASWLATQVDTLFRRGDNGKGPVLEHMLSLEALMSSLTLFQASDPRDNLYAILWLANDVRPEGTALTDHRITHSRNQSPTETHHPVPLGQSNDASQHIDPVGTTLVANPGTPEVQMPIVQLDTPPTRGSKRRKLRNDNLSVQDPQPEGASSLPPQQRPPSHLHNSTTEGQHLGDNLPIGNSANLPDNIGTHSREADADTNLSATVIKYDGPELTIEINYGRSVYKVCKDFMEHCFSQFGYIDMMCRPWAPTGDPKLKWEPPSWMMTLKDNVSFELDDDRVYRRVQADPLVGMPGIKVNRNYNASGASRAFQKKPNKKKNGLIYPPRIGVKQNLFLRGFEVAKIEEVGAPAASGHVPGTWLDFVEKVAPFEKWDPKVACNPKTDCRPPEAFWRTLVADRALDGTSNPPRDFAMCATWAFKKVTRRQPLKTDTELTYKTCPSHARDFLRRVQCVVWGRCMILGKCPENAQNIPLLCLGPQGARKGDIICILFGCSVPVILREEADGPIPDTLVIEAALAEHSNDDSEASALPTSSGKWYKFIGECYVHDMMNGEIFAHRSKYYNNAEPNGREFEIR